MKKFYDTSTLLDLQDAVFQDKEPFYISSITLTELEDIKNSSTRDEEIKYAARHLLNLLNEHPEQFCCKIYHTTLDDDIKHFSLPQNNDSKIIMEAYNCGDVIFYTSDLACYSIAKSIGVDSIYSKSIEEDLYTGYIEKNFNEIELANFYNSIVNSDKNEYNLCSGQYLLIKFNGKITDKYKWAEDHYEQVPFYKAQSKMFGKITAKDGDPYQQIALDSLNCNQITMLRGPAGTGKSYLAFGHMFSLLEDGKIDKIIIFCNTVATKGSAKLGFYPGSRTEKLLDSQIGNLLESKIGDKIAVERLIADGQLVLLPLSDIRGYDTTGMNAAIYISEAQNLDIELMRLALQRIGEDSICIIDGDDNTQVDLSMYAGSHNGMKRVSKIFRGSSFYGEIALKNIYRSEIAKLAQKL
jgi:predicted ribonuclease YlaK